MLTVVQEQPQKLIYGHPRTVPDAWGGPRTVPNACGGPRTVPNAWGGPRTVPKLLYWSLCGNVGGVADEDDDDDGCYIALFCALGQTHGARK